MYAGNVINHVRAEFKQELDLAERWCIGLRSWLREFDAQPGHLP